MKTKTIAIVGGGAAGMMAAGTALKNGASVTVFEHTDRLGKKLAITGKGRCNVTNLCDVNDFLQNVCRNPRFLYTAINAFSPYDTLSFFEELGVTLKVERGRRVFPDNDKAKTIVDAMRSYCKGAKTVFSDVKAITPTPAGKFKLICDKEYIFDAVIIATGGASYPLTGSDGSGYRLARSLGHSITRIKPSLVPLLGDTQLCSSLMGLSLKNVSLKVVDGTSRELYSDFGEMIFTHFGISGPMVLSASSLLSDADFSSLFAIIDLKPALDERTLDARLISDLRERANQDISNVLGGLLPTKMIYPFLKYIKLDGRKKANLITKEERHAILTALKCFKFKLYGTRPIAEAIVTSGGVEVKEIYPKNMQSRLVSGLYFAGEIIDVDALTGGYNLQIAFSTGYLAGLSASQD